MAAQRPLPHHLNIVSLQTAITAPPQTLTLPAPYTFTLTQYANTTAAQVAERIKDAHIVHTVVAPLSASVLAPAVAPHLRLVAVSASGTDAVDLRACAEHGIRVLNSPNCNNETVAEHVLALFMALRRGLLPVMKVLQDGDWLHGPPAMKMFQGGRPPRACSQETAAIVGNGAVGKTVARLFGALGMRTIVAGRKGASGAAPEGRVPFEEALKTATVVVLCCPLSDETRGLISAHELTLLREDALLIHVARGGVVDEAALLEALQTGKIAGAGVDVYAKEPASPETTPLLGSHTEGLNLITTPHTAWVGGATVENYQRVLQENIDGFLLGQVAEDRIKA